MTEKKSLDQQVKEHDMEFAEEKMRQHGGAQKAGQSDSKEVDKAGSDQQKAEVAGTAEPAKSPPSAPAPKPEPKPEPKPVEPKPEPAPEPVTPTPTVTSSDVSPSNP